MIIQQIQKMDAITQTDNAGSFIVPFDYDW